MAAKKGKKGKKKQAVSKVSLSKLSNKRINRLARQGKLKKAKNQNYVKRVLKERLHKGSIDPEERERQEQEDQEDTTDIPLEEADYEYFATKDRNFSFLKQWYEEESEPKPRRKKKRKAESDDENDVEARYEKSRKVSEAPEMRALLPIKCKQGIIHREEEVEKPPEPESEEDEENKAEILELEEKPLPTLSTAEVLLQRRVKLEERKKQIAVLSGTIIENPEQNISCLRELRQMLGEKDHDVMISVRKLAMASLLEVFKDILPAYRIRIATETEKQQAASKETRKLREYEEGLVSNYRQYLTFLENCVKGQKEKKNKKRRGVTAVSESDIPEQARAGLRGLALRCLCDMLAHNPNFNFRTNIVSLVVPFMNHRSQKLSDMVCCTVRRLFREDKAGEVTLEVVRLIGRMIKAQNFIVQPKVLSTFLSLRIKEVKDALQEKDKGSSGKDKRKFTSRRERKRKKQMASLEKELEEAAVLENKEQKLKLHTEVINMVFLTYFRILKQAQDSELLSPVLAGLAKFAHLINIDFFDDLFNVLNELVNSGDLDIQESLHCVQTAFTMLSGQGAALNIDPINFYRHLYTTILKLNTALPGSDLQVALSCMDVMVNQRRKQVTLQRLLAFIKRLTTIAMMMEAHGALGILATVRSFLHANPRSNLLFDLDSHGSGTFLPELEDPEHCNAGNTALWELHVLQRHYHPVVRRYTAHLVAGAPSQGNHQLPADLNRRKPLELVEEYDSNNMTFKPQIPGKPTGRKKTGGQPGRIIQAQVETQMNETLAKVNDLNVDEMNFKEVLLNGKKSQNGRTDSINIKSKSSKMFPKPRLKHNEGHV